MSTNYSAESSAFTLLAN